MSHSNRTDPPAPAQAPVGEPRLGATLAGSILRPPDSQYLPVWFALLLLVIASAVFVPATLSHSAISSTVAFASILAIASIGETYVVRQGGFDLSMPGTISVSAVILTVVGAGGTGKLVLALLCIVAIAVTIGLVMAYLVMRGVNAIVATLSVSTITMGFAYQFSDGTPRPAPTAIQSFLNRTALGLPMVGVVTLLVVVALAFLTTWTVAGRRFVAAGSNPRAARASGLRVSPHLVGGYVLASLCYAIGGVLYTGYTVIPPIAIGHEYLLPAFAAVVIGGTPFTGGRGSVVAVAMAALFLTQLDQLIFALGAAHSVQLLVQAGALVIAALVRFVVERRRRTRPSATIPDPVEPPVPARS